MKKKINVDYSVGFHVDGGLGKRKATRAKSRQIEKFSEIYHFVSLNKTLTKIIGVYLAMVFTELTHSLKIVFRKEKPDILFVRTFFGFFL